MPTHLSAHSSSLTTIERGQRPATLNPDHLFRDLSTVTTPSYGRCSSSPSRSVRESEHDNKMQRISEIKIKSNRDGFVSRENWQALKSLGVSEDEINAITQNRDRLKGGGIVFSAMALGGAAGMLKIILDDEREEERQYQESIRRITKEVAIEGLDILAKELVSLYNIEEDLFGSSLFGGERSIPLNTKTRVKQMLSNARELILEVKNPLENYEKEKATRSDFKKFKEASVELANQMDEIKEEAERLRRHYPKSYACQIM